MNRLQSELHRLYLPSPAEGLGAAAAEASLIDPQGRVRAMVLESARPADWTELSKLWRGVQAELELPAPAIAVSGIDGFQLWFSLAEPIPVARAHAFLQGLRRRFLPDSASKRLTLMPGSADGPAQPFRRVPAQQAQTGNWSAFVAPDLAPVFADAPWLDIPPGDDGQADLLARLDSIQPSAFEAAWARIGPTAAATMQATAIDARPSAATGQGTSIEARDFLLQVMHDHGVALALRIEAAKALLLHKADAVDSVDSTAP